MLSFRRFPANKFPRGSTKILKMEKTYKTGDAKEPLIELNNGSKLFFLYLFPSRALISAKGGAARIFVYHLMPWHDSNPRRVAPDWDL